MAYYDLVTVTVTPKLRLEQALKQKGIEDDSIIEKLEVFGIITDEDWNFRVNSQSIWIKAFINNVKLLRYDANSILMFGKYKGHKLIDIVRSDPDLPFELIKPDHSYIEWCILYNDNFCIYIEDLDKIKSIATDFNISDEAYRYLKYKEEVHREKMEKEEEKWRNYNSTTYYDWVERQEDLMRDSLDAFGIDADNYYGSD